MSQEELLIRQIKNPIVLNHENGIVYKDNLKLPVEDLKFESMDEILDAKILSRSKTASIANGNDPYALSDAFIGNNADKVKDMVNDIRTARRTRDHGLAAAIITSKDYSLLQDTVVIASQFTPESIEVGATSGLFEEIGTTTFSGKWRDFQSDLKWYRNIPEGKSPEPSKGTSSEATFTVQKHGGAVAITDRARDVINSVDIFSRLVNQLQEVRLRDENLLVIEELENNTGNTETGIDFSVGTNNPLAMINEIIADFGKTPETRWNLFLTKGFIQNWYLALDAIRGQNNPIPNQAVSAGRILNSVPGFPQEVTWVGEEDLSSTTDGIATNRSALKKFRGPTRQYTVTDPEKEYQKYTTKTHLAAKTVKPELVYVVTGVNA
jgi:hypothetical protein